MFVKSENDKPEDDGVKKMVRELQGTTVDELLSKLKTQLRITDIKAFEYPGNYIHIESS